MSIIYLLIGVSLFIISLFFESARDFYSEILGYLEDILGDVLGDFGEGVFYFISFEWIGDIPDFFGSMFENITEFSVYGVAFGFSAFILIFYTKDYMITPFLKFYSPIGQIFWTLATYITVFVGGYLMGKRFENT